MTMRSKAMVPSTASLVVIHINEYVCGDMRGRLYNPYLDTRLAFHGLLDFANKLDSLFDSMSFPLATTEYRSFPAKKSSKHINMHKTFADKTGEYRMNKDGGTKPQKNETFIVHVQFRQNATWQGTVKWTGQNTEQRFRSALELLKIMDSALSEETPEEMSV